MAEELQTQDRPEQVDWILDEILSGEQYIERLYQVDRALVEAQAREQFHIVMSSTGNILLASGTLRTGSFPHGVYHVGAQDRVSMGWVHSCPLKRF
jgi:hypothetical protein